MRKILYKTSYSDLEYTNSGLFHEWGNQLVETNEQVTNYTVGIVEIDDGSIVLIAPELIKFID